MPKKTQQIADQNKCSMCGVSSMIGWDVLNALVYKEKKIFTTLWIIRKKILSCGWRAFRYCPTNIIIARDFSSFICCILGRRCNVTVGQNPPHFPHHWFVRNCITRMQVQLKFGSLGTVSFASVLNQNIWFPREIFPIEFLYCGQGRRRFISEERGNRDFLLIFRRKTFSYIWSVHRNWVSPERNQMMLDEGDHDPPRPFLK